MGRRQTSSTKGGKFMNPTDQARKEQRKKELKKNKKQRVAVRNAVLKGKNPRDIVGELEKLDDMEFNVLSPPLLNDKVLKDKRRKLHETWNRVISMYEKDNIDGFSELKRLWHAYLKRKGEVVQHFESVRNAQNVRVEEIPLPLPGEGDDGRLGGMEGIPLPPTQHSILKKPSVLDALKPKSCPGVPAAVPPSLEDYLIDEDDDKGKENENKDRSKKIKFADEDDEKEKEITEAKKDEEIRTSLAEKAKNVQVDEIQLKLLRAAGQDVEAYMKELEQVRPPKETPQPLPPGEGSQVLQPPPLAGMPEGLRPPPPPPLAMNMMYRAPLPFRPGMAPPGVRLPPGPPPGRPQGPPPTRTPLFPPIPLQRPPAPVPGGVVSAGPQINKTSSSFVGAATTEGSATSAAKGGKKKADGPVIQSKAQLRNLKSDITRFVPTNLRVKRDQPTTGRAKDPMHLSYSGQPSSKPSGYHAQPQHHHQQQQQQKSQGSKDDAYAQFMAEMDQLLDQ